MKITLVSFGFRFGEPKIGIEDHLFDVRKGVFNPFKIVGKESGLDEDVAKLVLCNGGSKKVEEICQVVDIVQHGDFSIYIGCIGGRHRSVAIVEEVARILTEKGHEIDVKHRDINKDS